MTTLYAAAALFVSASATAELQGQENDWLIVPSVRVGPIRAASTEGSLKEIFGNKFVETHRIIGDVWTDRFGTLVYRNDLSRVLGLSWRDNKKLRYPATISFCFGFMDILGQWRTVSGIRCGTTLRELETINGGPFTLSGYERDGSGTVTSWQGGSLDRELGSKGAIDIGPSPKDRTWIRKLIRVERQMVTGDKEISSSDPVMQRFNPVVYRMVFSIPELKSDGEKR